MQSPLRLRQLEALSAVAEQGSMTRAAQELQISQPAVSRLLSDLSDELGFQLFERRGGRLVPTQETRFLMPDIRRLLEMVEHISEVGRNITDRRAGHLRIACLPGFATSHLPGVVARFLSERPGVSVTIEPDRPERILEWMIREQYDFGITDGFDGHPSVECEHVWVRSVCIFPQGDPLAARAVVTPADLSGRPLVHPKRDSQFHRAIADAFLAADATLETLVEVRQFTAACELVRRGTGTAIVSELDARPYLERGLDLRPFAPALPHRLSLVRPFLKKPSMLTLEFVAAFRDSLEPFRAEPVP